MRQKKRSNIFPIKNKKAYFDYEIVRTFEAGIELVGHEVKSIRSGNCNLKGSYISSQRTQELYIKGWHITPLSTLPNRQAIDSQRPRKIFLKRRDIDNLLQKTKESGYTLIPLQIYLKKHLIKCEIGLVTGRKQHQKRQLLKERSMDKQAKIILKKYNS